jgi:hypothetical protein
MKARSFKARRRAPTPARRLHSAGITSDAFDDDEDDPLGIEAVGIGSDSGKEQGHGGNS